LQRWIDPSQISAFYSIRGYQKLAWQDSQNLVEPPSLQFPKRFGQNFTYTDIPLCIDDFATMFHATFNEIKSLLEHDLLFGLTDQQLGVFCDYIDDPTNVAPGYGFLGPGGTGNQPDQGLHS
jgi:hypothetical protein